MKYISKRESIVMKKLLPSLALVFMATSSEAGIRQYSADLDNANWQLTNNTRLNCTLSHEIPNYGIAKFYSSANRRANMEFELDMLRLPDNYSLAQVRSVAPKWRPGVAGRTLANMKLHKQFSPGLPKKIAWTMLSELEQGMSPTFYYDDWYSDVDKISVGLSTAKFKKAYNDFIGCVGNLLNYNFDDIKYTVLNYEFGSDKLTRASKRKMNMITQYLALDPELDFVLVDGYTDSYGGRETNRKMSLKRANQIKQYLVSNGVAAERIDAEGYGEKRHVASNNTVLGRSMNRRVVIRMDKP